MCPLKAGTARLLARRAGIVITVDRWFEEGGGRVDYQLPALGISAITTSGYPSTAMYVQFDHLWPSVLRSQLVKTA
jgi:hypothetical protein